MDGTLQQLAIEDAKNLRQMAIQRAGYAANATNFQRRANKYNYVQLWQKQPTAPWNEDGSLGEQDQTPNPDHPIVGLGISANDLIGMLYSINQDLQFLGGTQEPLANPQVNQYERINSLIDS